MVVSQRISKGDADLAKIIVRKFDVVVDTRIVRGKVRCILHSTLPYVAVYALAAVPLAWLAGCSFFSVLFCFAAQY